MSFAHVERALVEPQIPRMVELFSPDFYIDADSAVAAVRSRRLFNLMHLTSGIKVDLIVRKDSEYRQLEFDRRLRVQIGHVDTWIVSREDLVLSKLEWARESDSDLQRKDVVTLLDGSLDWTYLREWAGRLGVADMLDRLRP